MNLKELLLEFAGENENSLRLEDLIVGQINGVRIEEDVCNGIRLIVLEPENIKAITKKIEKILEDNNYSGYSVVQEESNGRTHLLVEIE